MSTLAVANLAFRAILRRPPSARRDIEACCDRYDAALAFRYRPRPVSHTSQSLIDVAKIVLQVAETSERRLILAALATLVPWTDQSRPPWGRRARKYGAGRGSASPAKRSVDVIFGMR
jgi:hypothetical protein